MWAAYVVFLIIAAVVLAFVGIWPVTLLLLLLVPVVVLFGLRAAGDRTLSVSSGEPSVPSSREASYEPRVDPNRNPPGSAAA